MATTMTRPETVHSKPTRTVWLAVLAAILLVAVGFGGGFLTSQVTQDEPVGLADEATVSLIQDNMAAHNAGDREALSETVTEDYVFTAINPDTGAVIGETTGVDALFAGISQTSQLQATSELVQDDNGLVSATYSEGGTTGMLVFKIVDGKIAHTWVFMYER